MFVSRRLQAASSLLCELYHREMDDLRTLLEHYDSLLLDLRTSACAGWLGNDNNSITDYQNTISHFTQWCTDNYLELNVDKTK